MSLDFFQTRCQQPALTNTEFGLCDDQDFSKPAYCDCDENNSHKWIATVKNESQKEVTFTAIDKCVISDADESEKSRCDGMLTTDNLLFLIELKDKRSDWRTEAIEQLSSTIKLLRRNHDISRYIHKKAFACNRKKPHFVEIDNEQNQKFFREHGFRLDIQGTIVIIP